MPYIKQDDRDLFDESIDQFPPIETTGELNYVLTRLLHRFVADRGGNYAAINDTVGAIACVQNEFYRRVAAPYEDRKILENGDVLP